MQQWEYKSLHQNSTSDDDLNKLGADGWELICKGEYYFYFKRPIPQEPKLGPSSVYCSDTTGGAGIEGIVCKKCGQVYPMGSTHNCSTSGNPYPHSSNSTPIPQHNSVIPKE